MWKEGKGREVYIGGSNGHIFLNEVCFNCVCGEGGGTCRERKREERLKSG